MSPSRLSQIYDSRKFIKPTPRRKLSLKKLLECLDQMKKEEENFQEGLFEGKSLSRKSHAWGKHDQGGGGFPHHQLLH